MVPRLHLKKNMPEAMILCLAHCLRYWQKVCFFTRFIVVASCQHRYDLAPPRARVTLWADHSMTKPDKPHKSSIQKLTHWKKPNMNSDTKTALITGSGQNIGRGIAHHLAANGFNIIVNGSSDQEAAEGLPAKYAQKAGAHWWRWEMLATRPPQNAW